MMTLDEAIYFLMSCERDELCDHAFGDKEVYWTKDGKEVASGYFGGSGSSVSVSGSVFENDDATRLQYLGKPGKSERNDSTGPDKFVLGQTMPGLTLGGVLNELTKKPGK